MGKGLAEFRKASDDFKRTWEREVALESTRSESDNSIIEETPATASAEYSEHNILPERATPDESISRQHPYQPIAATEGASAATDRPEPLRKHDWL
jgi:hypothetical protein